MTRRSSFHTAGYASCTQRVGSHRLQFTLNIKPCISQLSTYLPAYQPPTATHLTSICLTALDVQQLERSLRVSPKAVNVRCECAYLQTAVSTVVGHPSFLVYPYLDGRLLAPCGPLLSLTERLSVDTVLVRCLIRLPAGCGARWPTKAPL